MDNAFPTPERELLRQQVARFVAREAEPQGPDCEAAGGTPRAVLRKMGAAGMLALMFAPACGGRATDVMLEEAAKRY